MGQLIDDLLAFSRTGRIAMKHGILQLNPLITAVIEEHQQLLEGRQVKWEIASLPPVVGDKTLLNLVLSNLIGNAIKFTESGKIEIQCR